MSTLDQQKIRRSRTGLIGHDPALAQPGYTLFAPMYGESRRIFSLGMPSVRATSSKLVWIIWFEVQSVSLFPFQAATEAWGSIIAWD